jgi:hypothetical protein
MMKTVVAGSLGARDRGTHTHTHTNKRTSHLHASKFEVLSPESPCDYCGTSAYDPRTDSD